MLFYATLGGLHSTVMRCTGLFCAVWGGEAMKREGGAHHARLKKQLLCFESLQLDLEKAIQHNGSAARACPQDWNWAAESRGLVLL